MYPGGKSGAGVYQQIINQMPPHDVYVEGFLGGGSIMKIKRPARYSIGIEKDPEAINRFAWGYPVHQFDRLNADALDVLPSLMKRIKNVIGDYIYPHQVMVYLDPPYLIDTRRSKRRIYRCELSEDDHRRLLDIITQMDCMVMISGYASKLYDDALTGSGWRRVAFQAQTRVGLAWEILWMNYPEPTELHDYSHVGRDYRERERIKRLIKRWQSRIGKMNMVQRAALMQALEGRQF